MSERQQHVEGQSTHVGRGIELLGDRYKGNATAIKDLDELGKIRQRPRQPIDLINNHYVDPACLDIGDKSL